MHKNPPIKEKSKASKKHGVENVIDDLGLLSYLPVLEAVAFAHRLPAVRETHTMEVHCSC